MTYNLKYIRKGRKPAPDFRVTRVRQHWAGWSSPKSCPQVHFSTYICMATTCQWGKVKHYIGRLHSSEEKTFTLSCRVSEVGHLCLPDLSPPLLQPAGEEGWDGNELSKHTGGSRRLVLPMVLPMHLHHMDLATTSRLSLPISHSDTSDRRSNSHDALPVTTASVPIKLVTNK